MTEIQLFFANSSGDSEINIISVLKPDYAIRAACTIPLDRPEFVAFVLQDMDDVCSR